jgi:hypothetical protein
MELISLNQAAARGIARVRKPEWATPEDHFKVDIVDGRPGPWLHLFAPFNLECNGRDPVDVLWPIQFGAAAADAPEFVAYTGPLPESDAYKAAVARYREAPR